MKFSPFVIACVIALLFLAINIHETGIYEAAAEDQDPSKAALRSHYIDQQDRPIKSLSAEDIEELKRGGGWGLAKAAELNGVPGPAHVLEMQQEIALTQDQIAQIQHIYEQMRLKAIDKGEEMIALERALEDHFKQKTITDSILQALLGEIAATRSELRYIHLSTHLLMPDILSTAQIAHYNQIRGYDRKDPCTNVPAGHNEQMWRKHNHCD
ncbi:MAG: Spy/CpxP family protein refolding chaperone [Alphaproteobacteria bacterium]